MNWIHSLWFHYAVPSLKNNGATMVLGVLFLPLLKKYLNAEKKRAHLRVQAAWEWVKRTLGIVGRVRVTVAEPAKPESTTTVGDIMGAK